MNINGYNLEINELDINAIKAFRAWENTLKTNKLVVKAALAFGTEYELKTRIGHETVVKFFGKVYG